MRTSKGIYYFKFYQDARDYALKHNWPSDRIIPYIKGWAIQLYRSGPYVGPKSVELKKQGQYL